MMQTGEQNDSSRCSLELHLVQQWQNQDPRVSFSPHNAVASFAVSRTWSQITDSETVQRIRDLPKQRMHESWNLFDFPDNPSPSCLDNLPMVTQLLILHIACNGFHNWQRSKQLKLEEKGRLISTKCPGHKTNTTSHLTHQSCELSSIPFIY